FHANHSPTSTIAALSLHDALPISGATQPAAQCHRGQSGNPPGQSLADLADAEPGRAPGASGSHRPGAGTGPRTTGQPVHAVLHQDRKSTRLNSSHVKISYAVFCLK